MASRRQAFQPVDLNRPSANRNQHQEIGCQRTPQEVIDEFNNQLGTYAEDVHQYLREDEDKQWRSRRWNCFTVQTEITDQMRSILIDWLCEVTEEYSLTLNTLFLTVNYVDRILEHCSIPRSKLQLLGVSCMLIACKFEEIHPPLVEDFVYITDNTYSREEIFRTELISLNTLKFSLTVCTIKNFLTRFLLITEVKDLRIFHHANYLAELTLPDYYIHQNYKPSMIAAAVTCIAKCSFNVPACTPVFELYCGYTKAEIIPCIQRIYSLHARSTQAKMGDMTSAREKYKSEKYGGVSHIPLPLDCIHRM